MVSQPTTKSCRSRAAGRRAPDGHDPVSGAFTSAGVSRLGGARFPAKIFAIVLGSLAVVSLVDWLTGGEFAFFVFYFVPLTIAAWYLGRRALFGVSILSCIVWWVVDRVPQHLSAHQPEWFWQRLACFSAFAVLAFVTNASRNRLRDLRLALAESRRAAEEVRRLQSQLQVVCAWTKRIKQGDSWVPLDQFLSTKLRIPITHGICPEAYEQLVEESEDEASCSTTAELDSILKNRDFSGQPR